MRHPHKPCLLVLADPLFIIPTFFTSGTQTRIGLCLFLHPVLLEVVEAVGRCTKCDATAKALQIGAIKTYPEAADIVVEKSTSDFVFKILMAFYRRMMLLNLGSPDAIMFGVVAASIEEASVSTRA